MSLENQTIHEVVQEMLDNDRLGNTKMSRYVDFNYREDIDKIEAYKNSKHISGEFDSDGRRKPFFNITISNINIWYRATDLDRKDIQLIADKDSDVVISFLENILLQEWMKKNDFGIFLNEWGLTLAEYLEAVVKFVEKGGELHSKVVPWNNLICDPIDFEGNPKVERLYFTPAQLRKEKSFDQEIVKELIESKSSRETADGQQKDNKADYIELYEVHGEFSLATLKESKGEEIAKGDEDIYVQQMHVISLKGDDSQAEDTTLISGKEDDPYMLTSLKPNAEGTLTFMGAVKQLFQAQWRVNDNEKQIKDHLELASKIFWQTSDGNLLGQNALTSMKNGQVVLHAINAPLTQLSNRPDISAMQSNKQEWQGQGMQVNGVSEAMMGQAPKSGTAWRQTQATLAENHSLFELYTENKGLYVEKMLKQWVIPFHRKKLNNSKAISAILEEHQIKFIDSRYVPNEAIRRVNEIKKKTILSGQIYDPSQEGELIANEEELLQKAQNTGGQQRFIKPSDIKDKTWKDSLKGVENRLIVNITGENVDVQAKMATYQTALQFLLSLQGRPMTDNEKLIFNRLLESSGSLSPIELKQAQNAPQAQPVPTQPVTAPQLTNQQ